MTCKINKFGWVPVLPDHRDGLNAATPPVWAKLSKKLTCVPSVVPISTKGELGSSAATAIAVAKYFDQMKQNKHKTFTPSWLIIYNNVCESEGTAKEVPSAMTGNGIMNLVNQGAVSETTWPFVIRKIAAKSPKKCYRAGLENQALNYQRPAPGIRPVATEKLPLHRQPIRVRLLSI